MWIFLIVDWFRHFIIMDILLCLPTWRWRHEWPKRAAGCCILNLRSYSWIKLDQLDVTCFIISLFKAQHVSNVSTSILRSLRLICWVISCVVSLWYDVCWCYVVVWVGVVWYPDNGKGGRCLWLTTSPYRVHVSTVLKSGSFKLLGPPGSVYAYNGIALPITVGSEKKKPYFTKTSNLMSSIFCTQYGPPYLQLTVSTTSRPFTRGNKQTT